MRDLLLYVIIAVGAVAVIIGLAMYVPNISHVWFSFVGFTSLLAVVLAKLYWHVRKSAKVWLLLAFLLTVHCLCYVEILRHLSNWPAFWYVLTMPVEVIAVAAAMKICLNVLPRQVRL